MKILIVHSRYRSGSVSGENIHVDNLCDILSVRQHTVKLYQSDNKKIAMHPFLRLVYGLLSPFNPIELTKLFFASFTFKPDIIHIHNTFPFISISAYLLSLAGFPTVITHHNYRFYCPSGIPLLDNSPCTRCLGKTIPLPSLLHKCYKGSRLLTLLPFASNSINNTLRLSRILVTRHIALTSFQQRLLESQGIPRHAISVVPNFAPSASVGVSSINHRHIDIIFAGRLSTEKGILNLVEALKEENLSSAKFKIAGDGPLYNDILSQTAYSRNIELLGSVSSADTLKLLASSKLLVVPSLWFEGLPMVILEAFSVGTPVLVSDVGALPNLVNYPYKAGLVFSPSNSQSLSESLSKLLHNTSLLSAYSLGAYKNYMSEYTTDKYCRRIEAIYSSITPLRP